MKNNIFPKTTKKASMHTCEKVNQNIRNKTVCCIEKYINSNKVLLSERINKLDLSWSAYCRRNFRGKICIETDKRRLFR